MPILNNCYTLSYRRDGEKERKTMTSEERAKKFFSDIITADKDIFAPIATKLDPEYNITGDLEISEEDQVHEVFERMRELYYIISRGVKASAEQFSGEDLLAVMREYESIQSSVATFRDHFSKLSVENAIFFIRYHDNKVPGSTYMRYLLEGLIFENPEEKTV